MWLTGSLQPLLLSLFNLKTRLLNLEESRLFFIVNILSGVFCLREHKNLRFF